MFGLGIAKGAFRNVLRSPCLIHLEGQARGVLFACHHCADLLAGHGVDGYCKLAATAVVFCALWDKDDDTSVRAWALGKKRPVGLG